MTDNYTQTIEVNMKSETRRKQILAFILILLALALFAVAAVVSWFIVIAAVAVGIAGGVYLHLFNNSAKEYIYDFSPVRLVISKKDAVNRTRRLVTLAFADVAAFGIMQDMADKQDVCAVNDIGEKGVYQISYKENGNIRKLYFQPDDYMLALLEEKLSEINK